MAITTGILSNWHPVSGFVKIGSWVANQVTNENLKKILYMQTKPLRIASSAT